MNAIILAGGAGTRLRSVISDIPKPMAPVNGRPFLEHVIEQAAREGVTAVTLSVGYRSEVIRAHFGSSWGGVAIDYAVETEPLGTGGALKLALARSGGESGPVLVRNGDTFFDVSFRDLVEFHLSKGADFTLGLKPMKDSERFGSVSLSSDGRVLQFEEKAFHETALINAGVYVVSPDLFSRFKFGEKFSLEKDFFEKHVREAKIYGKSYDAYFIDIGVPEDYARAQLEMR